MSSIQLGSFEQQRGEGGSVKLVGGPLDKVSTGISRVRRKLVDECIDDSVSRWLIRGLKFEARDLQVLEGYDRLDDVLHVKSGLSALGDQRLGDDQDIVKEVQESVLGGLYSSQYDCSRDREDEQSLHVC